MNKYINKYKFVDNICYIDCFNIKGELRGTILVDKEDFDIVSKYQWHIEDSRKDIQYAQTNIGTRSAPKSLRIHRLLMPDSIQVDHINHNGLDNRKSNLRACNNRENNCNKDFSNKPPKSGYTGIRYNEKVGNYYVRIMVHKKEISLGHYNNLDDALEARKQAEIQYFGKFRYSDEIC